MATTGDEKLLDEQRSAIPSGDETLLDEERRGTQAAVASIAAGLLALIGGVLLALVGSDKPAVPVLDALRDRLGPGTAQPGAKARQVLWYDEHGLELLLVAVVLALAAGAIGLTLTHLYRSTKARRPELPRLLVYAAVAGAVLVAVSGLVQSAGVMNAAGAFADSSKQTPQAARDAFATPLVLTAQWLSGLGVITLGFAFVMLALNGMRVGLLTRFMGVLGMIVGALFILPLGSSLPIVQAYWLIALGVLFLGRWPSGQPPAWVTGEAQPWPTQQQLREARIAKQAEKPADDRPRRGRRERAEPPETPAPEPPERKPHSSSKKRKRKRR